MARERVSENEGRCVMRYNVIEIPQHPEWGYYEGTTEIACPCGGTIVWWEAGYVPGVRACINCRALYRVTGCGQDRVLAPLVARDDGVSRPKIDGCNEDEVERTWPSETE